MLHIRAMLRWRCFLLYQWSLRTFHPLVVRKRWVEELCDLIRVNIVRKIVKFELAARGN